MAAGWSFIILDHMGYFTQNAVTVEFLVEICRL